MKKKIKIILFALIVIPVFIFACVAARVAAKKNDGESWPVESVVVLVNTAEVDLIRGPDGRVFAVVYFENGCFSQENRGVFWWTKSDLDRLSNERKSVPM